MWAIAGVKGVRARIVLYLIRNIGYATIHPFDALRPSTRLRACGLLPSIPPPAGLRAGRAGGLIPMTPQKSDPQKSPFHLSFNLAFYKGMQQITVWLFLSPVFSAATDTNRPYFPWSGRSLHVCSRIPTKCRRVRGAGWRNPQLPF